VKLRPHGRLGSYELESAVGEGGLGEVWKAHDTSSGRLVALRILPAPPPGDPFRFARFDEDIRKLMALRHPNVAQVYELIDGDGVRALACEWIDGDSLAKRIAAGPIPGDDVTRIIAQIANGLAAAHARDLVHGDIKPSNITLCADGVVKVVDLGLVEIYDRGDVVNSSDVRPASSARLLGAITGTAAYMSPEQIAGHVADSRADVWAFGCLVYEMLTGMPAFGGDDVTDTMAHAVRSDPEWTLLPPTTPAALVQMLRRCLEKDPASRFQRMPDVSASIRESIGQEGAVEAFLRQSTLGQLSQVRKFAGLELKSRAALSTYLRPGLLNRIRHQVDPIQDDVDQQEVRGPHEASLSPNAYGERLKHLSERDRALVESRLQDHASYDEIALRFSLRTAAAARMAVTRALMRLAKLLERKKRN